jgi:protoporphyrinogen/coproporphyrinogen III oxidase
MASRREASFLLALEPESANLVAWKTQAPETTPIGAKKVMSTPPLSSDPGRGYRIAIIGGGISGLAAAHRLSELFPQADLELFESSNRLGGVLHTIHQDDYLIEQSADNFLVKPSAGIDLCRRLQIDGQLLPTDESRRRAFIVRAGRLHPIPHGFHLMSPRMLWPVLTSRTLSLTGKLRLLAEPLVPRRFLAHDGAQRTTGRDLPDESIASFARRRLGREVFERIIQPLVAGIYTADPERLSMAATMPQFVEYERTAGSLLRATLFQHIAGTQSVAQPISDTGAGDQAASGARYGLFVAPRDGMSSLISSIADSLRNFKAHLNAKVFHITRTGGSWQIEAMTNTGQMRAIFHGIIVALAAPSAAELVSGFDVSLANELRNIEYAGCNVISLGYTRHQVHHSLDGFGFVVPRAEGRQIIAGSFASLKFPGRAPTDHVLIRVFIGGALQPELLALSDDQLLQLAQAELRPLLGITGEAKMANVARWPRSMPQYQVGHLSRVARIEALASKHRVFALAGNAYRGVGIPQCIASGEAAAERVAAALQSHS